MKRKRIIRTAEMTIETEQETRLRTSGPLHFTLMWCPACRRRVEMVTPERAAQIAGVSERMLHLWVESGTIHLIEDQGSSWICAAALSSRKES